MVMEETKKSDLTDKDNGAGRGGTPGDFNPGGSTDGNGAGRNGQGNPKTANLYDLEITQKQTLSKKEMTDLIEDIKANGIQESVKYVEHNGTKYIVDGHHRVIVAKKLGIKGIPVEKVRLPYKGYKTIEDLMWID